MYRQRKAEIRKHTFATQSEKSNFVSGMAAGLMTGDLRLAFTLEADAKAYVEGFTGKPLEPAKPWMYGFDDDPASKYRLQLCWEALAEVPTVELSRGVVQKALADRANLVNTNNALLAGLKAFEEAYTDCKGNILEEASKLCALYLEHSNKKETVNGTV
jgi:hypothetical protein